MSAQLIKQLVEAAGETAEVAGGRVVNHVGGERVVLGGPSGDSNTFSLTDAGSALLAEAAMPSKAKVKKEGGLQRQKPLPDAEPDEALPDLD